MASKQIFLVGKSTFIKIELEVPIIVRSRDTGRPCYNPPGGVQVTKGLMALKDRVKRYKC